LLKLNATIEADWHVYSQFTPEDDPLPTELIFHDKKDNYEVVGKATKSETQRVFNEIFGVDEILFTN
jgi:hypothetical protein